MADKELFGISEPLNCSDCVNHGGDWNCDHVQCRKGADTISRQAAIRTVKTIYKMCDTGDMRDYRDLMIEAFEALPSAQPDVSDTNVGKICEYYDLCRNGRDEKKLREELLSAQPGWIPTSVRLPKPEDEVLLTMDYKGRRYVELGNIWSDGTVHSYVDEYLTPDGRKYRKVLAWMPLPKPWEGR